MHQILALLLSVLTIPTLALATPSSSIRIASYNLENLFDSEHDAGKQDWEYLPTTNPEKSPGCRSLAPARVAPCLNTNWTRAHVNLKLDQMSKSILSQGALPDLLAVQEVENISVLRDLANKVGFQNVVLEEGEDERGIDVGLMYNTYKVELVDFTSNRIQIPSNQTRDILAVRFRRKMSANPQEVLAVYINHWPSQNNPSQDRVITAEKLQEIIRQDRARYGAENLLVVAVGDFNTVDSDSPHPFQNVTTNPTDPDSLVDARTEFTRLFPSEASLLPRGTYFFPPRMAWQEFDHFFLSRNLLDQNSNMVDLKTFRIHNSPLVSTTINHATGPNDGSNVTGVPKKYNSQTLNPAEAGYSDHFSVSLEIKN
jgi:endonuclease/exonuclease/phosphatase family metal-dependent hydrolase